jgi:hypothetical protein
MATAIGLLADATPELHGFRSIAAQSAWFGQLAIEPAIDHIRGGDGREWHLTIADRTGLGSAVRALARGITVAITLVIVIEH